MKIGVFASFQTPVCTPDNMIQVATSAEELGLDSLWMGEHVVLFDEMEFPYPGSADGKLPVPPGGGLPDTVVALSFLASHTKKLRFGTGVTLIPQRNPIYTANEFATLDYLTNGRVDLGIGVGWCKEEVEACGYDFKDRGERCDEILEIMKRVWTEDVVTHEGKHFQFKDLRMDPKPVQTPHIPLIIGGFSPAAMRRCAKYGDGWLGFGLNTEFTRAAIGGVEAALSAEGRSLDDFEIVITPGEISPEDIPVYEDMGVDRLIPLIFDPTPEAAKKRFDELDALVQACSS
ncbi:MAG: LLM class F420-dependent oxidoreductase [Gammaproteobacteria bacterium]|jgi:probable F420-dependent oxidoreductase|nr:LLM class F420-dependent oxidoreductase [Gammaproteobacteria bacterium]MBT7369329.1 LLM class F420-dependent oxidoreductase [Gammaproteobacteria bacterium]